MNSRASAPTDNKIVALNTASADADPTSRLAT
jgi:hypothetical protein